MPVNGLEQVGIGILAVYAIRTISELVPKFRNGHTSNGSLTGQRAEDMYAELIRNQNTLTVSQQRVLDRIDSLIGEVRELVKLITMQRVA